MKTLNEQITELLKPLAERIRDEAGATGLAVILVEYNIYLNGTSKLVWKSYGDNHGFSGDYESAENAVGELVDKENHRDNEKIKQAQALEKQASELRKAAYLEMTPSRG